MTKHNDWKNRVNVVYSTNPNFEYSTNVDKEKTTLPPEQQTLRISLEKKHRAGKKVTIITGFIGTIEELNTLGKKLKTECGVGGSVKNGEIIIQGDYCSKIFEILAKLNYKVKNFK